MDTFSELVKKKRRKEVQNHRKRKEDVGVVLLLNVKHIVNRNSRDKRPNYG